MCHNTSDHSDSDPPSNSLPMGCLQSSEPPSSSPQNSRPPSNDLPSSDLSGSGSSNDDSTENSPITVQESPQSVGMEFANIALDSHLVLDRYRIDSFNCISSSTVRSHLSELQSSEHVGNPNDFSKTTPTISGYSRRVSGLALHIVWQLKTQDKFYGQGRLHNKGESNCQSHPLGTTSLPLEMNAEQRLTVVRILVITTYTVSGSSLADL